MQIPRNGFETSFAQGYILGVDDCKCGKLGKYFALTSRVKGTEIRGCSDVHN